MSSSTICANCGEGEEESGNLKSCAACKLVKYCSRDCQIAHRPHHKKECKQRAAELYDEKLFKEIEPEECSICMLPVVSLDQTTFMSCCGKSVCKGCIYAMTVSGGKDLCAYCRAPPPSSEEEHIKQTKKLMEKGYAEAYYVLGQHYAKGVLGLPQDQQKANELFLKAGELGCASGYCNLGNAFEQGRGIEVDRKKATHYWEIATMMGSLQARNILACMEVEAGNVNRADKHFMIAARAGSKAALDQVKVSYQMGFVTKDEYASTLRAFHERQKEMKSDERDKVAASRVFT